MKRGLVIVGLALAGAVLPSVVLSQDMGMGLDGLHEQRREGGRVCMIDHTHTGSSSGMRSRKQAEIAAMRDYAGFTAWEYGPRWGSFANAGSKRVACSNDSGGWGCSVEARPCRSGRR